MARKIMMSNAAPIPRPIPRPVDDDEEEDAPPDAAVPIGKKLVPSGSGVAGSSVSIFECFLSSSGKIYFDF
jgi:hypothetical protein